MNELTKFCQQLRDLTKRIKKLQKKLMNTSDVSAKETKFFENSILNFSVIWN
jgi:hypothetical protein